MRLKIMNMKFINNPVALLLLLMLVTFTGSYAQEIIVPAQTDTVKKLPKGRVRIDGVVATVGDYVILDSDIDLMYRELQARNVPIADVSRCELLGKLMEDKLYAHHAIQDSVIVTDAQVNEQVGRRIDYFTEQLGGSTDKMVAYFKKKNLEVFKSDLFEIVKNEQLIEQMRKKVIDGVEVTPEEVRQFYTKFSKEDLPIFGAELEVAQIVIKPKISEEDKQKVIDRLKAIKKDVQDGASFYSKAVLYSEDPGSNSSGGYYKMTRKTQFVKEFKEAAFSMAEGEISEPIETEFGYHLIYVEKIRGQELDVRHILMSPKVTPEAMNEAKERIERIRQKIVNGEISFADAAKAESDEKETKNNGGLMINPKTFSNRFELTKMDPNLYNDIADLKDGEISLPVRTDDPRAGKSYKIMMVTNRFDEHPADYTKDYIKIKELALAEKQLKVIGKWSESKIKDTYVKVTDKYKTCEFANPWVKKSKS